MLTRLRRLGPLTPLIGFIAMTFILGDAGDAFARRKKAKKKTVAVFPFIARDDPDQEISDAVFALLSKASLLITNLTVITGPKLKKKLRKDPGKLVGACGSNLKCIAKLGKKARAQEALIAMVSPADAGGIKCSFLVVDSKKKKIARKASLTFATKGEVKSVLGGAFYELFGITTPGRLEVKGIDKKTLVRVGGKLVGKGPGPHKAPPGRHEVEVGDFKEFVMIMPEKTKTIEVAGSAPEAAPEPEPEPMVASADTEPEAAAAEPPPEEIPGGTDDGDSLGDLALIPPDGTETEGSGTEVAADGSTGSDSDEAGGELALEPAPEEGDSTELAAVDGGGDGPVDMTPPPPAAERGISPGVLTWVGAGVGGAGLLLAGIGGGVTGSEATSLSSGISPQTHTQLAAMDQQSQAEGMAGTSTALFVVGGVVAAAGVALAIVDLFVLQPKSTVPASGGSTSTASATSAGFEF